MTNEEIIKKVNEVVKDANFTKIMKVGKRGGAMYLILACGNGLGIYGSYNNNNIYANYGNLIVKLG